MVKLVSGDNITRVTPSRAPGVTPVQNTDIARVADSLGAAGRAQAEGLARMGEAMYSMGEKHLNQKQTRDYNKAIVDGNIAMSQLINSYRDRDDTEKFADDFDKKSSKILDDYGRSLSHEHRSQFNNRMALLREDGRLKVEATRIDKDRQTFAKDILERQNEMIHALASAPTQAAKNALMQGYEQMLEDGVNARYIDPASAEKSRQAVAKGALVMKLDAMARDNPEALQAALEDVEANPDLKLLTPAEYDSYKTTTGAATAQRRIATVVLEAESQHPGDLDAQLKYVSSLVPEERLSAGRLLRERRNQSLQDEALANADRYDDIRNQIDEARAGGQNPVEWLEAWKMDGGNQRLLESMSPEQRTGIERYAKHPDVGDDDVYYSVLETLQAKDKRLAALHLRDVGWMLDRNQYAKARQAIESPAKPYSPEAVRSVKEALEQAKIKLNLDDDDPYLGRLSVQLAEWEADYQQRFQKDPHENLRTAFLDSIVDKVYRDDIFGRDLDPALFNEGRTDLKDHRERVNKMQAKALGWVADYQRYQTGRSNLSPLVEQRVMALVLKEAKKREVVDDVTFEKGLSNAVKQEFGGEPPILILKKNATVPWVDRVLNPEKNIARRNARGAVETHVMAASKDSSDVWWVFPMYSQIDGVEKVFDNEDKARDYAIQHGDAVKFGKGDTAKLRAIRFSQEYKTDAFLKWSETIDARQLQAQLEPSK